MKHLLQGTCHRKIDAHILERVEAELDGFRDGGRVGVVANQGITDVDRAENLKRDEVAVGVQGLIVVKDIEATAGLLEKMAAKSVLSGLVAIRRIEKGLNKLNKGGVVLDTEDSY